MTDQADGHVSIGRDNFAPIINGNNNTYHAVEPLHVTAARHRAAGLRQLRLGLPSEAAGEFRSARTAEPGNPDDYYFGAIAELGGKKAFLAPLRCVRAADVLIHGALDLEDRPEFHYFLAYLRFDYYARKHLRPPAPWQVPFAEAWAKGLTQSRIDSLFTLLSVEDPLPAVR
ncbi:hypothetical protein ACFWUU_25025 [Kribbella sp. NPDC058693]|uniref:hypothetical protein n=1 Tax=Kribbella sp. NPDC058693 TaxID=3346602 RepID=UPI00365AB8D9